MIHDVITNSMDQPVIRMSEEVEGAMKGLRSFLFTHVYMNPIAKGEEYKAVNMVGELYHYYRAHLDLLPQFYQDMLEEGEKEEQVVCDYIAGMTDNYAVQTFEKYFVPESWKN